MAKISARGARELGRFALADGRSYLLRSDGTILMKYHPRAQWRRCFALPTPDRRDEERMRVAFMQFQQKALEAQRRETEC